MNLERELSGLFGLTLIWAILVLIVFGLLNWLHIPTGQFLDWLFGAVSFWWLMVIITIPWNVHFNAKAVYADAMISREKGIEVSNRAIHYVKTIQKWALVVALGLHGVSAIAFYTLALTGISALGYISSVAALLLTGLRPAIAAYRYLVQRLENIGRELKYPREDMVELRDRVELLATEQADLAFKLNLNESTSWAAQQARAIERLQDAIAQLEAAQAQFKAMNAQEHEQIVQEARGAIAQLNEDSRVLGQVREIIRFFKTA